MTNYEHKICQLLSYCFPLSAAEIELAHVQLKPLDKTIQALKPINTDTSLDEFDAIVCKLK